MDEMSTDTKLRFLKFYAGLFCKFGVGAWVADQFLIVMTVPPQVFTTSDDLWMVVSAVNECWQKSEQQ